MVTTIAPGFTVLSIWVTLTNVPQCTLIPATRCNGMHANS